MSKFSFSAAKAGAMPASSFGQRREAGASSVPFGGATISQEGDSSAVEAPTVSTTIETTRGEHGTSRALSSGENPTSNFGAHAAHSSPASAAVVPGPSGGAKPAFSFAKGLGSGGGQLSTTFKRAPVIASSGTTAGDTAPSQTSETPTETTTTARQTTSATSEPIGGPEDRTVQGAVRFVARELLATTASVPSTLLRQAHELLSQAELLVALVSADGVYYNVSHAAKDIAQVIRAIVHVLTNLGTAEVVVEAYVECLAIYSVCANRHRDIWALLGGDLAVLQRLLNTLGARCVSAPHLAMRAQLAVVLMHCPALNDADMGMRFTGIFGIVHILADYLSGTNDGGKLINEAADVVRDRASLKQHYLSAALDRFENDPWYKLDPDWTEAQPGLVQALGSNFGALVTSDRLRKMSTAVSFRGLARVNVVTLVRATFVDLAATQEHEALIGLVRSLFSDHLARATTLECTSLVEECGLLEQCERLEWFASRVVANLLETVPNARTVLGDERVLASLLDYIVTCPCVYTRDVNGEVQHYNPMADRMALMIRKLVDDQMIPPRTAPRVQPATAIKFAQLFSAPSRS